MCRAFPASARRRRRSCSNSSATSTRCWRAPPRSSRRSAAQSIIDNADKARISRELVTLKNDVPVADGLDDFVLQPPDGPKLIAFLKTMEFTTLTRRVAEATGTEPSEIEPAAVAVETGDKAHGPDVGSGTPVGGGAASGKRGGGALRRRRDCGQSRRHAGGPCGSARRGCRGRPRSRSRAYACIRDLPDAGRLGGRGDARPGNWRWRSTQPRSIRCRPRSGGFSLAIRPGRAGYIPIAHRTGEGDLLGGGPVEGQISLREALAAAQAAARRTRRC